MYISQNASTNNISSSGPAQDPSILDTFSGSFRCDIGRSIIRSHNVSKAQDRFIRFSYHSEIEQAFQEHGQIKKRYEHLAPNLASSRHCETL